MVTNDKGLVDAIRVLNNHGRRTSTDHAVEGFNARLDGIQGAVLSAKLPRLEGWNDRRRQAAERYNQLLADVDVVTPAEMPYAKHIYHVYVIRVKNRDEVKQGMAEKGVGCGMHYPIPIHLLDAYKRFNRPKGTYPVTEAAAEEILSLPMFPEITAEQQQYVVDSLADVLGKMA